MNEKNIKKDWQQRGYSYGVMVDKPGQQWEDFQHNTNELVAVLKGELTVIVAGLTSVLAEGDEVFIPAQTLHSVLNETESEVTWAYGYDRKQEFTR